jgi:hypothetical protein
MCSDLERARQHCILVSDSSTAKMPSPFIAYLAGIATVIVSLGTQAADLQSSADPPARE